VSYSEWQERSVRVQYSREITQPLALHPGPSAPPATPALSRGQIQVINKSELIQMNKNLI